MTITIQHPVLGIAMPAEPHDLTEPGDPHARLKVINFMDSLAFTDAVSLVSIETVRRAVEETGTDEEKAAILVRSDDPDAEEKFSPEITDAFLARCPLWDSEENVPTDDAPMVVEFSDQAISVLNEITEGGTWSLSDDGVVSLTADAA